MSRTLTISELVKKASAAIPVKQSKRCAWGKFDPVIETLRANGFDLRGAVGWLVQQKQIPADQQEKAYKALSQLKCRREKKAA